MELRIKKLHKDAILPVYANPSDAGMDLFVYEKVILKPGERQSIQTGIAIEIPQGFVGLIWDKSGLSHKYGIKTFGGVVDAGYRGEIKVGIMNLGSEEYIFDKGNKIAQMIIQSAVSMKIIEVDKLSESIRGNNGFGSTGK